jgi:predicted DNA-binding transcriptional regulator AlpA
MTDIMSPQPATGTTRADDTLLSQKRVATMLSVTPRAVEAWRIRGEGPSFIRISSRCIRYRRSDVEAWLSSRERLTCERPL